MPHCAAIVPSVYMYTKARLEAIVLIAMKLYYCWLLLGEFSPVPNRVEGLP